MDSPDRMAYPSQTGTTLTKSLPTSTINAVPLPAANLYASRSGTVPSALSHETETLGVDQTSDWTHALNTLEQAIYTPGTPSPSKATSASSSLA